MKSASSKRRVLVIGIDGATWDLLDPWIKHGELPILKKLKEDGVYGKLKSTIPPLTGPAWVSFATGKNPGKHGCYDFLLPRNTLDETKIITTNDIKGQTFYEILDRMGRRCILMNLPCSYPPRIHGIIITSFLEKSEDNVFPHKLVEEIPELKNYQVFPENMSLLAKHKTTESVYSFRVLERSRFNCSKRLFQKNWDFFFVLFGMTDWIQHHMYDKLISRTIGENSEPMKAFMDIDKFVGWFVNNAPKDANILVVSDHGFSLYKKKFAINRWLIEKRYLKIRSMTGQSPISIHSQILQKFVKDINVPKIFLTSQKMFNVGFLFYRVAKSILPIRPLLDIKPDLSETIAYSLNTSTGSHAGIYINAKGKFVNGTVRIGKEYEKIRNTIIDELSMIKDPKTRRNIFRSVLKKENVYSGEELDKAPDIIIISDEYIITKKDFPIVVDSIEGHHSQDGIFIAFGPDIKNNMEINRAKIYDIAPTILHILGVSIPKDMDGRVLKEVFKEDGELAKREVVYEEVTETKRIKKEASEQVYSVEEEKEIKKRLRSLGYI